MDRSSRRPLHNFRPSIHDPDADIFHARRQERIDRIQANLDAYAHANPIDERFPSNDSRHPVFDGMATQDNWPAQSFRRAGSEERSDRSSRRRQYTEDPGYFIEGDDVSARLGPRCHDSRDPRRELEDFCRSLRSGRHEQYRPRYQESELGDDQDPMEWLFGPEETRDARIAAILQRRAQRQDADRGYRSRGGDLEGMVGRQRDTQPGGRRYEGLLGGSRRRDRGEESDGKYRPGRWAGIPDDDNDDFLENPMRATDGY